MADYSDDDFVYVDPEKRTVVGKVHWQFDGVPVPLKRGEDEEQEEEEQQAKGRRKRRARSFPWGSYRTMKRVYRIEGKTKESTTQCLLDDALQRALREPYWD